MATMEKPKEKKKHKTKSTPRTPSATLENIDIDFPTTSIRDDIPTFECFIASQPVEEIATSNEVNQIPAYEQIADALKDVDPITETEIIITPTETDNKHIESEKEISKNTIPSTTESTMPECTAPICSAPPMTADESELIADTIAQIAPTAPFEQQKIAIPASPMIQYPNLENLKIESENNPMTTFFQKSKEIHLKPFTQEQLNELYYNPQISLAEQFEKEFVNTELNSNYKDHLLYELLMKYSKSRYNLKINLMDLQNLKKTFSTNSDHIWTVEKRDKQYSGQCQDGFRVTGTESYDFALINETNFDKISSALTDLLNLISFNYTLNAYATNVVKIQIEQYIRELLCQLQLIDLYNKTSVSLNQELIHQLIEPIRRIRISISILFGFLRSPIPDKTFLNDLKSWIKKIISIHLRVATWQDHLFLLFHILRCPAGIASWATALIQVPSPQSISGQSIFNSLEVHHCVSFLKILLLPINTRKEFLMKLHDDSHKASDSVNDELWILVDSDGEEDKDNAGFEGLKENDLISLLNQVPLEKLFSEMTFCYCKNGNQQIDCESISGHHLIRFIAFATRFIELLGEGLKTYDTERYRQFSKMLCRLIRHTVLYVANMHAIFRSNDTPKDDNLCDRIQIEYDTFVLRASQFIYKSRCLGTWQYLAILPFADLCTENAWKLYYSLSVGFSVQNIIERTNENFKEKCLEGQFLDRFNDSIVDLPAEDMYYILQTFSSMALARKPTNWDFIERVSLDLFKIGFVNLQTKENCYKIVKDLLNNITSKYPVLISSVLVMLKANFQLNDTGGIYLFKSLPIDQWRPTSDDLEIIASWLLNFGIETPENTLARTIFGRLNWNFDSNNDLFLSHDIHIRMACLIVQVYSKHAGETLGSSGISESVRQVSILVKSQSTKQQFVTWCWSMISILRLHCMDQHRDIVQKSLQDPSEFYRRIPELERIAAIFDGVSDSKPLALYASILSSMWGHSVPQICHKGFIQLQALLTDYRHAIVIRCLHLIVPLFLDCPESLSKCDRFQSILAQLLAADKTYLKMAKDLINSDYPGPVVELLCNMIQAQLTGYYGYGLSSPLLFVNLWLQCLTQNSTWTKDTNSLYLIDTVLSVAYQFSETWFSAKEYFRFLHMRIDDIKSSRSIFLPFLSGSRSSSPFPLPSCNTLWLSILILELEHEMYEVQTNLWPELLIQLKITTGKFTMDNVLKKTAALINYANYSTNALVLYKLVNLILSCTTEHALLPIVCQKFFHLFLARVPLNTDEERFSDIFGVADKFYEANISLMKRLKKFLIDAENKYKEKSLEEGDEELAHFYNNCSQLFRSYGLWLEETRFNKISNLQSTQCDFPPQYNLTKLATIFAGNETPWTEFLNFEKIRKTQLDAANNWLKNCFRFVAKDKYILPQIKPTTDESPSDQIIKHLKSYDNPIAPPELSIESPLIENFSYDDVSKCVLPILKANFKKIDEISRQFEMNINEIKCLDCNYKELIRLLYRNEKFSCSRQVKCSMLLNNCRGSNSVKFNITHPMINDTVQNKIEKNRERHEKLISKLTSMPPQNIVMAIVEIQHYIRQILEIYNIVKEKKDTKRAKVISDVGIHYFYKIVNSLNEYLSAFPPTNELCAQALSSLGILIQENQSTEGINLLQTALRRPNLINLISDLFIPSTTGPIHFLEMYKFVVESHMNRCDSKILFVLLSKFDILNWLIDFKPKLSDISQLIKLNVQGLTSWNQNDAVLIQGVLRRHLMHIFEYDFPEHYGEVLQIVIDGCSDQSLMPCVLMDLLNSIYKMAQCNQLDLQMTSAKLKEEIINFATTQKLLPFKDMQDTIGLLARHFRNERLQHGLHGLYPKHKNYCDTIVLMFKSLGFAVVVAAVHAYPGTLADNLVEWIWPNFCDMFSPWLVPYYPQSTHQVSANWIKQVMSNSQILLPWSELHVENAQKMFHSIVECIQFMIDTLPANTTILSNIFYWYEIHFGNMAVPRHVLTPIHSSLTLLPWNKFKPTPVHINCFYRMLQQFIPECHSFTGYVFLRVNWTQWLQQNLQTWDFVTRHKVLSSLLLIFIKLAFEPHVRENVHFVGMIQEAASYPWHILEYQGIEGVFEWFFTSAEPSIVLRLPSEYGAVDNGVLKLLQIASAMDISALGNASQSQIHAKQILYVRTIVKMLRICGSKHQQLLSTKEGLSSFHSTVIDLLNLVEKITSNSRETETINLLIEIVGSLQSQGESVSRIFVEAMIIWQSKSSIGNTVLNCILNAIASCKMMSISLNILLEATIFNYFRGLEAIESQSLKPNWKNVLTRIGGKLPDTNVKDLIHSDNLLVLHVYILLKLKAPTDYREKIELLQEINRLIESSKSCESTEPKLAIIWGLMITSGYEYLKNNCQSENQLLTLGRYLQTVSNHSDGWGEGFLEAIGIKKDGISKKRRILTRCLACIVFSLFPDKSSNTPTPCKEYNLALEELMSVSNSKKYADIRSMSQLAIDLVERQREDLSKTKEYICRIIKLFYKEPFLHTLKDVWEFSP